MTSHGWPLLTHIHSPVDRTVHIAVALRCFPIRNRPWLEANALHPRAAARGVTILGTERSDRLVSVLGGAYGIPAFRVDEADDFAVPEEVGVLSPWVVFLVRADEQGCRFVVPATHSSR